MTEQSTPVDGAPATSIVSGAIIALLVFLLMVGSVRASAGQDRWQVEGLNASANGLGGGLVYACASNAPYRGAVTAVFRGVAVDGLHRGSLEASGAGRMDTLWDCSAISGTFSACFATPRDVARLRDLLIRGREATAIVDDANRNPRGVIVVSLRGSARAIARVRRGCKR